ncbi:hypothetical protein IJ596_01005, partial [bacterium]|nr:hypothetical protein [bacterium]
SCKNFIFFSWESLSSVNLNNFIFPFPRFVSNPPAKKNSVPSGFTSISSLMSLNFYIILKIYIL